MPIDNIHIQSMVSLLLKISNKLELGTDSVTIDKLDSVVSVLDFKLLGELVSEYDKLSDIDKQLMFITLSNEILNSVSDDLDKLNVSQLIHLKVTLITTAAYTLAITVVGGFFIGVWTGHLGVFTDIMKSIWSVIETMFLN